jgi:hypothetical protein
MELVRNIQYDKISLITEKELSEMSRFNILFDISKPDSIMATIAVKFDTQNNAYVFERQEIYDSLKELSTVTMKELLMLFAKRAIINSDSEYFHRDDPKLHSFLSKLSYPSIEDVCSNLEEFAKQFKSGHVTLNLGNARKYKNQPIHRN